MVTVDNDDHDNEDDVENVFPDDDNEDIIMVDEDHVVMTSRVVRSASYRISTRESAESETTTADWNRV